MPTIAYEDEGVSVLSSSGLVAFVWRDGPNETRVNAIEHFLERHRKAHPNRVAILAFVQEKATMPPMYLRERIVGIAKKLGPNIRTVVWVVSSKGFQSSLVRSLFTGLFMIIRPAFKPHMVDDLQDGIRLACDALELTDTAEREALYRTLLSKTAHP